ncbi:MAG: hypothetical protein IRY95_10380, partial [Clostridia bacterium]|nr:hypothetical protein [Clostridia bacterium]
MMGGTPLGPVPFGTGAGTTSAAIGLAPVLLVAFLTGMAHAAEPDHLAAVSTLVAMGRGWGRALLQGLLWG